jgi:hypothetical protein
MISAVFSLFSGGLRGGSVYLSADSKMVGGTYKENVVVLRLGT